jgi:hypothetical protein
MTTKYVYTKDKLEQAERALRLACEQISSTFCPIEFFAWKPPHYCPIICTREMRIECRVRYYIEKAGDK